MNSDWVPTSPKRLIPEVVASAPAEGDAVVPSVSLAFPGLPSDELITVTVIGSEFELRKFQRDLDRAITKSLRNLQ